MGERRRSRRLGGCGVGAQGASRHRLGRPQPSERARSGSAVIDAAGDEVLDEHRNQQAVVAGGEAGVVANPVAHGVRCPKPW